MAHPVNATIQAILKLDTDKIIRPTYGATSLLNWEKTFNELIEKIKFIEKYSEKVATTTNDQINSAVLNINSYLTQLIQYNETQFVTNKQQQVNNIDAQFNQIKNFWPSYAIAAIEDAGLLTNVDVKEKFQALTDNLKTQTEDALKKIETESGLIIEQAKKKAKEIEDSVRKTAEKISVKEAQDQFQLAADHNIDQIKIWAGITGVLIAVFIGIVIYLLKVELPTNWTWQIIYFSIIRVALLTLVSTILAFCIKILKGHLHMHQHNLHRKRIANSMASFAESATTREQRDIILAHLVESVTSFGNSGIVGKEDDTSSKITVDNITRTLGSLKG